MRFTEEYKRYIKSPQWAQRRAILISKRGGRCEVCGTAQQIKLHHAHYATLTKERTQDVRVLCQKHHLELHALHRKAGRPDLYTFTLKYISSKRR